MQGEDDLVVVERQFGQQPVRQARMRGVERMPAPGRRDRDDLPVPGAERRAIRRHPVPARQHPVVAGIADDDRPVQRLRAGRLQLFPLHGVRKRDRRRDHPVVVHEPIRIHPRRDPSARVVLLVTDSVRHQQDRPVQLVQGVVLARRENEVEGVLRGLLPRGDGDTQGTQRVTHAGR